MPPSLCNHLMSDTRRAWFRRAARRSCSSTTQDKQRGAACIASSPERAAHLPGMLSAITQLPVLGVPVPSRHLKGMDSLLSIVQMPRGIPTATFAIGESGAANAGLFAAAMLAVNDLALASRLAAFRTSQSETAAAMALPQL